MIRADEEVCRRLGRAVRARGVQRGLLREEEVRTVERQVAVDLVRGDLMVALNAVLAAGVHEYLRAEDVRLQEDLRRLNAAVHMGLRGKVHDDVGLFRLEDLIDALTVTDVGFEKLEVRLLEGFLQCGEVARVGQAVHAEDTVFGVFFQ